MTIHTYMDILSVILKIAHCMEYNRVLLRKTEDGVSSDHGCSSTAVPALRSPSTPMVMTTQLSSVLVFWRLWQSEGEEIIS